MSASSVSRSLQLGGARLVYRSIDGTRSGRLPFLFQHGMGGDADQPLSYVGDTPPTRMISLTPTVKVRATTSSRTPPVSTGSPTT